jgi:hypothetical protein
VPLVDDRFVKRVFSIFDERAVHICRRREPVAWARDRADNVPIAAYKFEIEENPMQ